MAGGQSEGSHTPARTAGGLKSRFSLWLWKTTEAFQRADLVLLPLPAPAGVKAAQINGTELRRMGS